MPDQQTISAPPRLSGDNLLRDLHPLLRTLETDLRERAALPDIDAGLRAAYQQARDANRTGDAFEVWRAEQVTQAAVAWILATVFVRFLEDNDLLDAPRLAGPGPALQRARDAHTLYFQRHPSENDRDWLLAAFRAVAALPGAAGLFDERHNPLWDLQLSADGAAALLAFWQRIDPASGALLHDFTDPEWDTRFLGDLYQDLSAEARKRYALLQTPRFVEAFILDRTLTPAIDTFGYRAVRLIDPACGSGHFLLGAFRRLFDCWQRDEPATNPRELARRALDQVYGVDLNPFAVAVARFRLLIEALRLSGIRRLADAPDFHVNVAAGDSLLHGRRFAATTGPTESMFGDDGLRHVYAAEDADALRRILGQRYHAVVGNPPYITPKDSALNAAYRDRYGSCHRQYSLAVPFMERLFELALPGSDGQPAGFVGMITANSFMKREFGKKLIEQYIPSWDVTHVIDTSGAYIPGHGTPTVILFGRNRAPVEPTVRTVMGIRGEPSTPDDAAQGLVWTAIVAQVDRPGSSSEFVSVSDVERATLAKHPWSIGGGGAAELKQLIEESAANRLADVIDAIGFVCMTRADDVYFTPRASLRRQRIPADQIIINVEGERVRDWGILDANTTVFPYQSDLRPVDETSASPVIRFLWPYRSILWLRREPNGNHREIGLTWYEWSRFQRERFTTPLSIAFAEVATHNHFVLDRGGKVFKQTAPVIKLPPDASEDDHLALLGLLNSSVACFWLKQVCHCKGAQGINEGGKSERWEQFYALNAARVAEFPVAAATPRQTARSLEQAAAAALSASPPAITLRAEVRVQPLHDLRARFEAVRKQLFALQEKLDWQCYLAYDLISDLSCAPAETPQINLGERAFEIVMARKIAAGELNTTWFERHGSTPITEIPAHWPAEYQDVVRRQIELIETDPSIRLIEQPEYKRRWNTEPWDEQLERALRGWLLDRLEDARYWPEVGLTSCARLADRAREDAEFLQVAELYRGRPDFDLAALVAELVEAEAVPFLPVLRYKPSGLEKRRVWERTWELQRQEDAIDARVALPADHPEHLNAAAAKALKAREVGDIPAPPRYTSADFLPGPTWRLRGKLDVPKERFISYPHCARAADPSLVVAWAGWDHLQQARALAAYYLKMKTEEGWGADRLIPLLAGLAELIPWLRQWHNDVDPEYNERPSDSYIDFLNDETRKLTLIPEQVASWTPPAGTKPGARRKRRPQGGAGG